MPIAFNRRLQERQPTQAGGQRNCADNWIIAIPGDPASRRPAWSI